MPGAPSSAAPAAVRRRIYEDLDSIREVRNRPAHHEPIFARDPAVDLRQTMNLVELRSQPTAQWLQEMEEVSELLRQRPTTCP